MAIPATTYDIATISNPTAALTDFTLIVDLSNMSTAWWAAVNTTDGTKGRASKSDGIIELACDFIDFDSTLETGILRVKYTGTLASTGIQQIRVYPPNTANTSYLATDTYGQYNAYDSNLEGYWPLSSDFNDRTINQFNGIGTGGISAGDATGQMGAATDFDGSLQSIDLGATSIIDGATDFTFIANANPDTTTGVNNAYLLFGRLPTSGVEGLLNFGFGPYAPDDIYPQATTHDGGYHDIDGNIECGLSVWNHIVLSVDVSESDAIWTLNGIAEIADTYTSPTTISVVQQAIGASGDESEFHYDGKLQHLSIHSTFRTVQFITYERLQIVDNATFWGTWVNVPVSGGFTLTAESGTLSITGQTATLKLDRKLIADSGALNITGNQAALTINRILQANSGSLTITGQDANLVYGKGYILSADAGAIIITGQPVSLTKTNVLTAESGSLNISGKNVTLIYSGAVSAYYEIVSISGELTTKTTLNASLISIKSINGQAISIEDIEGELI